MPMLMLLIGSNEQNMYINIFYIAKNAITKWRIPRKHITSEHNSPTSTSAFHPQASKSTRLNSKTMIQHNNSILEMKMDLPWLHWNKSGAQNKRFSLHK